MIYHNYLVVVGRLDGDDEDHARYYEHMTVEQARQQFINEVRRDDNIPEADIVAGYAYTNVYINQVLTSTAPVEEQT